MGCSSGSCATKGCGAFAVTDWLSNMLPPDHAETRNVYEVKFKSVRRGYYRNELALDIAPGDWLVVEGERGGYDLGMAGVSGEWAQLKMAKAKVGANTVKKIFRLASPEEVATMHQLREREAQTLIRARAIATSQNLDLKVGDIEYQGDGSRIIVYFAAKDWVDFRDYVKALGQDLGVRVEMKQLQAREEAAQVTGVGTCGRELCCSTWLTKLPKVTIDAARYQNVGINQEKITGLCGRLKCCLNYELDQYLDALKTIPKVKELKTEAGPAYWKKTDIFKQVMWFAPAEGGEWVPLTADDVRRMAAANKKGELVPPLADVEPAAVAAKAKKVEWVDVVGQSNLHEREEPRRRKRGSGSRAEGDGRGGRSRDRGATRSGGRSARPGGGGNQPQANANTGNPNPARKKRRKKRGDGGPGGGGPSSQG